MRALWTASLRSKNRPPTGSLPESRGRAGILTATLECERPDLVVVAADRAWWDGDVLHLQHHNAYVRTGQRNSLLQEVLGTGLTWGFLGVSSSTSTVTEATTFLAGAAAGTAANTQIKALTTRTVDAATVTNPAGVGGAVFTQADFAPLFVINKLGLLLTATDAGTGLVDVIGGTGGTAPYARTFSLDVTAAGTFSFAPNISVTAPAV